MGSKRSFADVGDSEDAGADANRPPRSQPKRRKHYGSGRHKAKEGTSEFAKKRVRNIERLLRRNKDLPANVHNDLERELAALRSDVADKAFHKKRSAMIAKYHMVRFFERKKASRLVKQLRRQLGEGPDSQDVASLKRQLHVAEVDEAYTLYHPHMEPYVSLYRNSKLAQGEGAEGGDPSADKGPSAKIALDAERPPMWEEVERTMEQGREALERLRERRLDDGSSGPEPKRPAGKKRANSSEGAPESRPQPKHHVREEGQGRKERQGGKATVSAAARTGGGGGGGGGGSKDGGQTGLNRRERRRLQREAMAADGDSDSGGGGGFFEEA